MGQKGQQKPLSKPFSGQCDNVHVSHNGMSREVGIKGAPENLRKKTTISLSQRAYRGREHLFSLLYLFFLKNFL